jgi:hypothetical protein
MWRVNPNDATSILYDDMNVLGLDVFYDKPISAKDALTIYAAYNNSNYGKTILEVFLPGPGYSRWLSSKWFWQWIHWRWYWKYLLRTSRIFVCKA